MFYIWFRKSILKTLITSELKIRYISSRPGAVVTLILALFQILLARCCFLFDADTLAVNNRSVKYCCCYEWTLQHPYTNLQLRKFPFTSRLSKLMMMVILLILFWLYSCVWDFWSKKGIWPPSQIFRTCSQSSWMNDLWLDMNYYDIVIIIPLCTKS